MSDEQQQPQEQPQPEAPKVVVPEGVSFPRMMYNKSGLARLFHTAEEYVAEGEGWLENLGKHGIFTAPSQEQMQAQKETVRTDDQ